MPSKKKTPPLYANDGEALLADIIANPSDDGLRLIYADWLEEHSEAERARWIRHAIANPSHLFTITKPQSSLTTLSLFLPPFHNLDQWSESSFTISRGFISSVSTNLLTWMTYCHTLAHQPLESVFLVDLQPFATTTSPHSNRAIAEWSCEGHFFSDTDFLLPRPIWLLLSPRRRYSDPARRFDPVKRYHASTIRSATQLAIADLSRALILFSRLSSPSSS